MNRKAIINVFSAAILVIIPIVIGKIKAAKATTIPAENGTVVCEIETETFETEKTTEYFTPDYNLGVRKDRYSFIPLSKSDKEIIRSSCEKYNIDYDLMLAVAKQESCYQMSAYNPISGDYGMFQINVKTWNKTANENGLCNYKCSLKDNSEMACYIMSLCMEEANGDTRIALNYYRTGTPNAKYEAESDYASIILKELEKIRRME
nr:MAG TPA: Transglycosylase SLT domain [Caudoviricetes sp.]